MSFKYTFKNITNGHIFYESDDLKKVIDFYHEVPRRKHHVLAIVDNITGELVRTKAPRDAQRNDALNAINQLSQASDYLLGNLLSVTEGFPEKSLAQDPESIFYTRRFDVLNVTVFKEYHEDARPTYKMCWQLDDTSWRTLAEALITEHIEAKPLGEYTRLAFDHGGHEFMCLMLSEQAERLGYIEPEQMVIKGV